MSAIQAFQKDIPTTLKALEHEYRTILGVEIPRRGSDPM
jgi:hypothetical protein